MSNATQIDNPEIVYFGAEQTADDAAPRSVTSTHTDTTGPRETIGDEKNGVLDNPFGYDRTILEQLASEPLGWMAQARCAYPDTDIDVFFPLGKEWSRTRDYRIQQALKYCGECVVKEQCAEYGLVLHEKLKGIPGIFGGLDEEDRKKILRNNKIKATSTKQ